MVDHPNVEVARRAYKAFAEGDVAAMRDSWADDVTFHIRGVGRLDGDYRGPEAVLGFLGSVMEETGGTFRLEVHSVLADDEHGVTLLTQHAERGGQTRTSEVVHVVHLRDGRTTEFWAASTDPVADVAFWA